MGYVSCMGVCVACSGIFSFNPVKVPSIRLKGKREPICSNCIDQANAVRAAHGIPLWEVAPDAYEACDEGELDI